MSVSICIKFGHHHQTETGEAENQQQLIEPLEELSFKDKCKMAILKSEKTGKYSKTQGRFASMSQKPWSQVYRKQQNSHFLTNVARSMDIFIIRDICSAVRGMTSPVHLLSVSPSEDAREIRFVFLGAGAE